MEVEEEHSWLTELSRKGAFSFEGVDPLKALGVVAVVDAAVRTVSASCYRWYVLQRGSCCGEDVRLRVQDRRSLPDVVNAGRAIFIRSLGVATLQKV